MVYLNLSYLIKTSCFFVFYIIDIIFYYPYDFFSKKHKLTQRVNKTKNLVQFSREIFNPSKIEYPFTVYAKKNNNFQVLTAFGLVVTCITFFDTKNNQKALLKRINLAFDWTFTTLVVFF